MTLKSEAAAVGPCCFMLKLGADSAVCLTSRKPPPAAKGGENHNSGLESALREQADKRKAAGTFGCSTGLQLQRRPVPLSVPISRGTRLPWQNVS